MRMLFLVWFLALTLPFCAWAKEHEQVYFAVGQNLKTYPFNQIDPNYGAVKPAYGWRVDYLRELSPNFWGGLGYSRFRGTGRETEANGEYHDLLAEYFAGDREKMAVKGPFWEKLFFRVGGRAGYYRWMVQPKLGGRMTELRNGPIYYSSGWTFAPYAAIGLGQLGSLEYAYRLHLSGGADTSYMNNYLFAYVYALYF